MIIYLIFFFYFFVACNTQSIQNIQKDYEGPILEIENLNTFLSDSAKIRLKLISDLYQVLDNGDEIYPNGLFMEIYSKSSDILIANFKANHVIKYSDDNYYIASGNVILFNLESNDELRTEELFWYPNDDKFETQKFVTIKTNNEIHSGEGMESNQDFSNYKILRPTGTIEIDEN